MLRVLLQYLLPLLLPFLLYVSWSLLSGSPPEETYIPPHVEDGEIVPGNTVAR